MARPEELARISSGDKVLIHSATGGVGQAAIAVARAAGAEIFATAGSEERRQILRDMGIEHVYDSRSTEFADQIRWDTDGYGVDIVLNSVPGAAQRAGLELLAFGGRFVEIGKRDIYADTRLGLFTFRRNLSFYAVDLALMTVTHPDKVRGLLEKVYRLIADGALPLPEITRYPLAESATAIRRIGGAQHTGKLVLDVPHTGHSRVVVPPEQVPVVPQRRCLHRHRWSRWAGTVSRREDGRGGLRAHRAHVAHPADRQGEGDRRADPGHGCRHCGRVRRYRRGGHRRAAGGSRDGHRATSARGASCRGGRRGLHPVQYHRRTRRTELGAKGVRGVEPAPGDGQLSRWTGSARSRRQQRWWDRRGRVRTLRPTAGWTHSRIGVGRKAFRPVLSHGERGPDRSRHDAGRRRRVDRSR